MFTSFPFAFWRGESGGAGPGLGYRYGYEFDGVDENLNFGNVLDLDGSSAFSFSFWIKRASSQPETFISKYAGNFQGFSIYSNGGGSFDSFFFLIGQNSSNTIQVQTNFPEIPSNKWMDCVVTYDGTKSASGVNIYINNNLRTLTVLKDTFTGSSSVSNDLIFGSFPSSYFYDGRMDDVQFYDFELNATQVSDIYNSGYVTAPTASPIHHWKLGEEDTFSTNWTVKDSVGSLDGTSVNMEEVDRKLGVAYSLDFDGVDDGVNFGDINDVEYNDSKTFSFWINTTDTNNGIIGKFNGSTGWNISLNSGGTVSLQMYNSALNRLDVSSTNTINVGAWKHIAIKKTTSSSASGVEIYIDGVSETKIVNDDTLTSTTVTAHDFEFGSSSSFLNGYLTEISLFDSSLSSLEVADLYNSGVPVDPRNLGLTPSFYTPLVGPNDSYDGTNWTITDEIAGNNGTSVNMQEADKTSETP